MPDPTPHLTATVTGVPPQRTTPPGESARDGRDRRWRPWPPVILVLAPPVLHLLSADLVTLLLLWCTAALLLRSRATVLDRLLLSAALLVGWTCVLGLLASVWPWGLHPVALAEATALPLALLILRRRPRLGVGEWWLARPALTSLRPSAHDWPVLLPAAGAGAFLLAPVIAEDAAARLAEVFLREDSARHFAMFDAILRLGGYLPFHPEQTAALRPYGFAAYPQGSHLVLAVLTEFAGGRPDGSTAALGLFVLLTHGVLTALVLTVLWAVRRAAGPALNPWAALPLCLAVAGYLVLVEATRLLLCGFESEIFGLCLLALLAALAIRPLDRPREQTVLLGALLIAIAFCYYLLLPLAVLLVLLWAALHRRMPGPRFTLAVAATVLVSAALPMLAGWNPVHSSPPPTHPSAYPVSRNLLLPLLAVAMLGLWTRAARRNPGRRVALRAMVGAASVQLAVRECELAVTGHTSFDVERALHQVLVLAVISLGAAFVPLVGRPRRASVQGGAAPGAVRAVFVVVSSVVVVTVLVLNAKPGVGLRSGWRGSPAGILFDGEPARPVSAKQVITIAESRPRPDDRIGVLMIEAHGGESLPQGLSNLWLGVLAEDDGLSVQAWLWSREPHDPQQLIDFAVASPTPVRFYLDRPDQLTEIERLAARSPHPDLELALVRYTPDGGAEITEESQVTSP